VSSITSASDLTTVINNHVTTLVSRYKGKIYAYVAIRRIWSCFSPIPQSWDVVNEVFNDDGTFRSSVFFKLLGENFIDIAFKAGQ
jgi:endo-1,4-beta-xylanase